MSIKILIVGAGWVGFPLGETLVDSGYQVLATTTSAEKLAEYSKAGLTGFQLALPVEAPESVSQKLQNVEVAVVTVPPRGGQEKAEKSLQSLIRLLESARIPKVLFTSSTSVYPDESRAMTEKDAISHPSPHSGVAMLDLEDLFMLSPKFKASVVRFGGLFGPDRQPGRFLSGRKNVSSPEGPVNMTHREDAVGAIVHILEKGIWNSRINVVAPEHPSRRDFYAAACQTAGLPEPSWDENDSSSGKKVSSSYLINDLGYKFRYPNPISTPELS